MNRIEYQVRSARRRLILGAFGRALCVSLFVAILVATFAIAAPAIWVMDIDAQSWTYGWIIGAAVVAILSAAVYAFTTAPAVGEVATEVDKRFELRERLSSSLSMDERERESDFGIALMTDAEKRASQLAVADRFQLKPSKLGWLPVALVPVLALVLFLVEPAKETVASSDTKASAKELEQVKKVAEQLKKRIQQQRKKADAQNLTEAKELFEKMEAKLDKLTNKKQLDKKQAMIAMNDLKKQLEERRGKLGSPDEMKKMLSQLKSMENGPAEEFAKKLEKGEFGKAQELVKELAKKMKDGKLSDKEKEQLKKQLNQMQKQMEKAAQQHEQKKQELQQKIDQARREGRSGDAAKMQQQMNQMQQQDGQMQQMQQMAQSLKKASDAMKQGDAQKAADAMQEMSDQLGEMADEMSELEDLQSTLDQLSQSKNQMRCKNCGGAGCKDCQGMGQGQGQGQGEGEGNGLGEGNGRGDRPENETDTDTYETQVRGDVKKGRAIIAGLADGPNKKGVTREELKSVIEGAISEKSNPLESQALPRAEREHVEQYIKSVRTGK